MVARFGLNWLPPTHVEKRKKEQLESRKEGKTHPAHLTGAN